ncbi:MAG: cob(I)yrinic acid a,c-diamide adenosyltransferase [Endomicrobiia bacterium]
MKGLIQVYTGDGKGKTTASIGQAIRSAGAGFNVCFIQFFKNKKIYSSEHKILEKIPNIKILNICPDAPHFLKTEKQKNAIKNELKKALKSIKKITSSGKFDLVILDELNIGLHYGLIKLKELLNILSKKSHKTEIIITGRYAPKKLLAIADLVTEMRKIKHYYDKKIPARKGIEF